MRIHSIVGIITNSSTIIYSILSDSAVKSFKKVVDEILKQAGSDKTCDDVFNVAVTDRAEWLKSVKYDWNNWTDHEEKTTYNNSFDEYKAARRQKILDDYDSYDETKDLLVLDKKGNPVDIVKFMNNIYYQESKYDG
jgi:hypothetical protein